jgi:hypothetical protein
MHAKIERLLSVSHKQKIEREEKNAVIISEKNLFFCSRFTPTLTYAQSNVW